MNEPLLSKPLTDSEGLQKAYSEDTGVWTQGSTMYVAGTKSAGDVWDDLKIPFGLTAWSQRYKDAERTLQAMPQVSRVVGHSLGGAVAQELQKNKGTEVTTYGAPVAAQELESTQLRPSGQQEHGDARNGFFGYDRTLNLYR